MHVVICLEGCYGAGKTSITQEFKDLGFATLDEGFMTVPPTLLHPQSLLMETSWVCSWFQRLMNHVIEARKGGSTAPTVIVTDRSPLSAVFYCRNNGALLEPLIREYVRELSESAGIHVLTVHLHTPRALLWARIQERLRHEPHRIALNEDSEKWMDDSRAFYDGMRWDATVENGVEPLHQVRTRILSSLESCSPALQAALSSSNASTNKSSCSSAGNSICPSSSSSSSTATASDDVAFSSDEDASLPSQMEEDAVTAAAPTSSNVAAAASYSADPREVLASPSCSGGGSRSHPSPLSPMAAKQHASSTATAATAASRMPMQQQQQQQQLKRAYSAGLDTVASYASRAGYASPAATATPSPPAFLPETPGVSGPAMTAMDAFPVTVMFTPLKHGGGGGGSSSSSSVAIAGTVIRLPGGGEGGSTVIDSDPAALYSSGGSSSGVGGRGSSYYSSSTSSAGGSAASSPALPSPSPIALQAAAGFPLFNYM